MPVFTRPSDEDVDAYAEKHNMGAGRARHILSKKTQLKFAREVRTLAKAGKLTEIIALLCDQVIIQLKEELEEAEDNGGA